MICTPEVGQTFGGAYFYVHKNILRNAAADIGRLRLSAGVERVFERVVVVERAHLHVPVFAPHPFAEQFLPLPVDVVGKAAHVEHIFKHVVARDDGALFGYGRGKGEGAKAHVVAEKVGTVIGRIPRQGERLRNDVERGRLAAAVSAVQDGDGREFQLREPALGQHEKGVDRIVTRPLEIEAELIVVVPVGEDKPRKVEHRRPPLRL